MDRIEKLMDEYPNIKYVLTKKMPQSLAGIVVQNTIYLNTNQSAQKLYVTLSEELGHWNTSSNQDITDYKKHSKEEIKAREWGYQKVIPLSDFIKFRNEEVVMDYYISDELDLPIGVVREAFEMYQRKGVL